MLGRNIRLVRRLEWLTLWPKPGPLPQTSHFPANPAPLFQLPDGRFGGPTCRVRLQFVRCQWRGPTSRKDSMDTPLRQGYRDTGVRVIVLRGWCQSVVARQFRAADLASRLAGSARSVYRRAKAARTNLWDTREIASAHADLTARLLAGSPDELSVLHGWGVNGPEQVE